MKSSRQTFVRQILCAALACFFASTALAGSYSDLAKQLKSSKSREAAFGIIKQIRPTLGVNKDLDDDLEAVNESESDKERRAAIGDLIDQIELFAMNESVPASESVNVTARKIKLARVYRDAGVKGSSNWLAQALERLRNIHWDLPEPKANRPMFGSLGKWAIYVVWGILAAVVLCLLFFAARHVRWKATLRRKSRALLEDDEPDHSLDEWLALADEHAKAGRHREAIRGLYLACLLRYDEQLVARFDRGQTNWEHLARIQASPKYPTIPDFRATTQAFDRAWYGHQVRGKEDVDKFRAWYQELSRAFVKEAA